MTTPLEDEIRALVAAEGPIPVSCYMALALGHPRHGYYMTRDPLGAAGDFTTAPEISQMFGELIGLWAVALWQEMGAPAPVRLVELGPGRGTLMADALRAARLVPAFGEAACLHLVETSPVLRAAQAKTLAGCGLSPHWHARIEDVPEGPAIVLANEFFDALPVDQYVRTASGWHERRVGIDADGALAFGLHPAPSPVAARLIGAQGRPGDIFERLEAGPAIALSRRLAAQGGGALVIDYGHAGGFGDTLQALEKHAFADPLAHPGEADLTAHVDFRALAAHARGAGLRAFGLLGQGEFLRRLGLAQRAERLKRDAAPAGREGIDDAVHRLTEDGATGMGRLFKVLALMHPDLKAPPAFVQEEEFRP